MEARVKRFFGSSLLLWMIILALCVSPASAAQNETVIASAVIVPAQITRLSFLTSAPIRDVLVKEGENVTAGQTLVVLHTPDLEFNAIAAQEAYRSAQAYAELQRYKRVKDRRKGKVYWDVVPPEVRQRADAQAASAQIAMEIAQATLAQSTMTAPVDATVASIDVVPGVFVQQHQVVMTLATMNDLQLETTDLSERDILNVRIGAPASIFIEALNETVSGEVIRISPKADVVGGDVVFQVTIAFDRQPRNAMWGMTAEVTIGE
jgi:RND family efflux transporter MFP subunit